MTTKHTPGPWRESAFDYERGVIVAGEKGVHVAKVEQQGMGHTAAANAALIAAAPDLLAALEGARAESRRIVHPDALDDRLYRIDRILTAAIGKATGIKE